MYYYILEAQRNKNDRFQERLIDATTDLGIAGEIVSASSLKSLPDLITIGLSKGYTTFVAVGSDFHIHQVINHFMEYAPSDRPVLGVLPTAPQSNVGAMIQVTNQREALHALKTRRLAYANLMEIDPHKFILTQASLVFSRPTPVEVEVDQAHVASHLTRVTLFGDGRVELEDKGGTSQALLRNVAWLFGATPEEHSTSIFQGEYIRLVTQEPEPLLLGGQILAKTPLSARRVRRALKMIVSRATVSPKEETEE